MTNSAERAMAIVGVGAILPDAPNAKAFWENIQQGRDSISEVSPERWDPALFYDADPTAPDKTYSKIGGWVRQAPWEPVKWHLPIPPRVADAMDWAQKWAVACTHEALEDYGYPQRPLPLERTGVILGNAMGGEHQFLTVLRAYFPEYARELEQAPAFASLPLQVRRAVIDELHVRVNKHFPDITEDTMPGELSNCIAGRIANLFNFRGPNFTADAACASAMAAITAAVEGLAQHDFDVAITGGIDRNMGASTFIKFSKIGALSATGSRPYADGADGFVMGEGGAIFVIKRLADAERDGDKIYAVLRAMGGSSDGKGKGITAPNPVGQKLSVSRAWENAGLSPATAGLFEGHGTSTKVGDVVETESLAEVLRPFNLPTHSVALGSVKSNIGHLKSAAGGAGILKATLAIHHKVLPPSIHCERPNPGIDFTHSPLFVNTSLQEWKSQPGMPRRAGVSAFGFGGTNFHAVLEEHIPNMLTGNGKRSVAVPEMPPAPEVTPMSASNSSRTPENRTKAPLRGALLLGAATEPELIERLRTVQKEAAAGRAPAPAAPLDSDLRAPERIAIDYADAADLAEKAGRALKAFEANQRAMWKALRGRGIFRGHGDAPKVAFLYTGQGSQYVNMLQPLRAAEPIVAEAFAEADRVMAPLLGKPLTEYIFVDKADNGALAKAEDDLRQTAITQPAVLATDIALTRLLGAYGIVPDMTMGHSLGEYGALVAAGALPFADALEAVSARGREMTRVAVADNGRMAAVFAPLEQTEQILKTVDGYVVIANINSEKQAVIGGASAAVEAAIEAFQKAGVHVIPLPVSHAFHTSIVAPASGPLRNVLERLHLKTPVVPVIANVTGEFYPMAHGDEPKMLDILARQVASPVQFVKGLRTLYQSGVRIFVETGPKRALQGFVDDVLGEKEDVLSLSTNHPKNDIAAFNQALCGFYAAGLGHGRKPEAQPILTTRTAAAVAAEPTRAAAVPAGSEDLYRTLGRMFADVLERGWQLYGRQKDEPAREPVGITGAALGLPGTDHIFDDANVGRILRGDQFIDTIPAEFRQAMLNKNVTRLVKSENGGPTFESIHDLADVIKLAGRGREFDLEKEFGVSAERLAALDRVTQLAMAAGIGALRDAGIPLVMRYKTTTKGTQLPDRWMLPESLRDTTGVIFASAFPGYDSLAQQFKGYYTDRARREQLASFEGLLATASQNNGHSPVTRELERRIAELRADIEKNAYVFDRRFLFRVLSMGHSQFAEYIGARGPNTQVNAACASTTQAIALAEDWIRSGRCTRVLVISADDVTSDNMLEWIGAGFLASGAAATDEVVEDAAIPFDRRRHGMLIGMGAAAVVVESAEAARERGIQPICQVLAAAAANSAFHGTRLDVQHIGDVMERLVSQAERTAGIERKKIAPQTVFVSHETYTPARGGSASAEIFALRRVFGDAADQIVIANTKGFTGHPMGTGIEDVVAVKALETGVVPPVANFKEVDPELGRLNLSKGGSYPVQYALRLAAGFGSQISMTLLRWVPAKDGVRRPADQLGYSYRIADPQAWNAWLTRIAGQPDAELEVVKNTLRIRDRKAAARPSAPEPRPGKARTPAAPDPAPVTTVPHVKTRAAVTETAPHTSVAAEPAPTNAAPATVTQTVAPAPRGSTGATADVKARILAIVSEKTGYPTDMLDVDLDLEADLGVDTVKQAEVFAAVRESYGIGRDENLKLRDFPTLAHVIRFVHDRRPGLTAQAVPAPVVPPGLVTVPPVVQAKAAPAMTQASSLAEPDITRDGIKRAVLAIVVEKTGYPQDMLDLDLDLEADLGVDTVKQAEMFAAVRERYHIPRDENRKLRDYPTLAHVIRFVEENAPGSATGTPAPPKATAQAPAVPPASSAIFAKVAAAPATAPAPAVPTHDDIKGKVLAIVVQKTGYPQDMLDLDLDLEADLGVDTVKQAEMFAAIRELYHIPRDENRKLRDYPTLAHVIRFVEENLPAAKETSAALPVPAPAPTTAVPPAKAAVATAVPAAQAPTIATDDDVKDKVLEIVAEKTGYPKDMLDLDLDLEADLGIDTVKQAEMFAAVRAAYNIPRDENLKLRDFPTLAHVIRFALDRRGGISVPSAAPIAVPAQARAAAPPAAAPRPQLASFEAAERIPRRVAVPVLRPAINLCKPSGVSLAAGKRVVLMPDRSGVADTLAADLKQRGVEVLRIETADPAVLDAQLKTWLAAGPVHGLFWLPALDHEGELNQMDLAAWHSALQSRVKALYTTTRTLYEHIAKPGTFLVSATRLGGQHGYDSAGAFAPLGGAVTGFTKTYKRERPEAHVKAVDFEATASAAEIADRLIDETLRDPGAVEIGYQGSERWTVALEEQPVTDGQPGLRLGPETVFLVTGAAGSIVSAITADLAAASGGAFYLLDLVPEPDPNNADLKRFVADKDSLKRDIFARIQASGTRATPALVEKELAALERAHAAHSAIEAVRASGGNAHYFAVDLTNAEAVASVIAEIRRRSGRIDVLLHAAGMERSHFLPDKQPAEFDLVFNVKSDGWFNLLRAIGDMPLGATVAFSSIAGRFGNAGQADYSSANDLLCKMTSSFRTTRPATRAIAIDWTAWGGIGMATRGSIPKMMEVAGIDMLPPEAGIPWIRRELTEGGTRGEVLVGERLGVLLNEFDPTGGLDTEAVRSAGEKGLIQSGPMVGKVTAARGRGLVIETTLDPKVQPFLFDHQIDGTPVLPGVMGIEAFAEAASCLLPGCHVESLEDITFLAPFKYYRSEKRALTLESFLTGNAEAPRAECLLMGRRDLPGQSEPQVTTHFRGRVRLARRPAVPATTIAPIEIDGSVVETPEIYRVYFHGAAYQVIERAWWDGHRMVGRLRPNLPPNHVPQGLATVLDPRLIELCFQTAGLWELGVDGRFGLPQYVREIKVLGDPRQAQGRVYAVVTPDPEQGAFDAEIVDSNGHRFLDVIGYRTVTLPGKADPDALKALQAVMADECEVEPV